MTALHVACYLSNTGAAEALLERGLDMNARTTYGQTAIHHAREVSDVQTVKISLRLGAQEDLLDYEGKLAMGAVGRIRGTMPT